MAAGLGFKDFVTGEVLTAADVDGYLMQGIWVFASTAARDAAVTSPQEGNFAFTKDNNSLWYYDGAAWVASGATGDIEGVTAGIGISGGGTSGTVTVTNSMATAIDAKGDLVAGTGADTFAKLTVGANNTVLTADSAEATGLKWATPAASGGMTLINTGGTALSGGTVTISSFPGTYKHLYVIVTNARTSSSSVDIDFRLNGDAGTNYGHGAIRNIGGTLAGRGNAANTAINEILMTQNGATATHQAQLQLWIPNYTTTGGVGVHYQHYGHTGSGLSFYTGSAVYNNSAAITSLSFLVASPATFSAGTAYVYGVS